MRDKNIYKSNIDDKNKDEKKDKSDIKKAIDEIKKGIIAGQKPYNVEEKENGQIKFNFKSPLEIFFVVIAVVCLFAFFFGFIPLIMDDEITFEIYLEYWYLTILPLFIAIISLFLQAKIKSGIIIDPVSKEVIFVRKIFMSIHKKQIANFSDVYAFSIQGKLYISRSANKMQYFGVIILKNGKLIRITNDCFSEWYKNTSLVLSDIAEKIGLSYFEGKFDNRMKAIKKPVQSEDDFSFTPFKKLKRKYNLIIFSIIIITSILTSFFLIFVLKIF